MKAAKMYRFYNTGQSPLRAEKTVTVQPPLVIQAPVEDIYSYHTWIHGVGVLSHSSFDHGIPGVSVKGRGESICKYSGFNRKHSDDTKSGHRLCNMVHAVQFHSSQKSLWNTVMLGKAIRKY